MLQGNPLRDLWYVKNAASSSLLLFFRRKAEFEGTGKLEGQEGCLPPGAPPRPLTPPAFLGLQLPPLQWASSTFTHFLFHSLQWEGKRENKTLKITVSILKKEKLSYSSPPNLSSRPLPAPLPPPPPYGAHVCFLQHRGTWFHFGTEPHQDGEEIHIRGTLRTEPPPAREAGGLQQRDEGLDRGIAAHAVRGGAGGGEGVGRLGRGWAPTVPPQRPPPAPTRAVDICPPYCNLLQCLKE